MMTDETKVSCVCAACTLRRDLAIAAARFCNGHGIEGHNFACTTEKLLEIMSESLTMQLNFAVFAGDLGEDEQKRLAEVMNAGSENGSRLAAEIAPSGREKDGRPGVGSATAH